MFLISNNQQLNKDLSGSFQGAGGVGGLLAVSINGVYYYPFSDHIGNITHYVNSSGTVVAQYEYDPFGKILSQSGGMAHVFRFRFSTKYYDDETGLYDYGMRFYNPVLGRWINRDPIGEDGGLNLYAFCGNDPVNKWDYLGLAAIAWGSYSGWKTTRNSSQSWAEVETTKNYDTFYSLATQLKLEHGERTKWLKKKAKNGTYVFVDANDEAKPNCKYQIPNVMAVYTSKSRFGDGYAMFVTQLKRKAVSDGDLYQAKGYKVDKRLWASSAENFTSMWSQSGIFAISFAGHGTKYGFLAQSGDAVSPTQVFPPYKLQGVRAYSCLSDSAFPSGQYNQDGTQQTVQWRNHVSSTGTFVGYTGLANWLSQTWQYVGVNAGNIPD